MLSDPLPATVLMLNGPPLISTAWSHRKWLKMPTQPINGSGGSLMRPGIGWPCISFSCILRWYQEVEICGNRMNIGTPVVRDRGGEQCCPFKKKKRKHFKHILLENPFKDVGHFLYNVYKIMDKTYLYILIVLRIVAPCTVKGAFLRNITCWTHTLVEEAVRRKLQTRYVIYHAFHSFWLFESWTYVLWILWCTENYLLHWTNVKKLCPKLGWVQGHGL